ncbi:MAG: diacylglycerol kinase family lipid kinase [Acidobacteria bacterium]|nr:diacylglycerol kinase family lipid kinase [Acidobacteriota bacterium]
MSIVAILNPKAQQGRLGKVWADASRYLPASVTLLETKRPGHAIELARNALLQGARTIIAVGGDGTVNEVLNGFFQEEKVIASDAALAIVPHGTGSDFRRSLKLPLDPAAAAKVIQNGEPKPIDVMKVRYTRADGSSAVRFAANLTSFGMGGAVAARASRSSKRFGGRIAFLLATLHTAASFRCCEVLLTFDEGRAVRAVVTNVAVGNGQYHGGGMWVCPGAVLDDGILDVTIVEHLSVFEIVWNLPMLYNGRIYEHSKVQSHRVKRLSAESSELALIEIDGELLGKLPLSIEVVPKAINVLV